MREKDELGTPWWHPMDTDSYRHITLKLPILSTQQPLSSRFTPFAMVVCWDLWRMKGSSKFWGSERSILE